MDVTLVLPNVYLGNRIGDHESKEPLGLLYLAAVLRQIGHSASIIQADYYGLSVEQTADIILFHHPSIVGLSITQRASPSALKLISLLRQRGYSGHITAGGYLPSLCINDFLVQTPEIDSVVVGEGEETFIELVQFLNSGKRWRNIAGLAYRQDLDVVINQSRPLIQNLDAVPFPARDLLADAFGRMGYATLISSRGCYGNCTFCPQNAFKKKNPGPRWRGRSPENVVDEIEIIYRDFGIEMFKFNDDDIFGPGEAGRQRIVGICEEILKRGIHANFMAYCRVNDIEREILILMRRAGFERLLVGVESSVPAILKEYQKGISPALVREKFSLLEELGFSVIPGFMMFNPYSTLDQLETDLGFLWETKSYGVSISKTLKVHDSTEIKNRLIADGRLKTVPFYQGYHEYEVDNGVARVFKAMKLIWSKIIDPVQADYQDVVTRLKKSTSFNKRQEYDEYLRLVWEIQANIISQLINWVRYNAVDVIKVKGLIAEIQRQINDVVDYLHAGETPGVSRARQFRLYPFQRDGGCYCLDLVSSQIFPVDPDVLIGLRILMSDQSTERLQSEIIERVRMLENGGLIQTFQHKPHEPLNIDQFAVQIVEILQDCRLSTMTERYFWENKK